MAICLCWTNGPECCRFRTGGYVQTTTSTPVIVEVPVVVRTVPVIPPLPPGLPSVDPNPVVAQCGECGLMLRMVMGYVCPSARCPVQPKVTC